jgi:hypothetical protein
VSMEDRPIRRSCPMASFGINRVETSVSATVLLVPIFCYYCSRESSAVDLLCLLWTTGYTARVRFMAGTLGFFSSFTHPENLSLLSHMYPVVFS